MVPLRTARKLRGISQRELAKSTGIQQASISLAELGKGVSKESAAVLARFFGHPWDERHFLYPERYEVPVEQENKAT